MSGKQIWSDEGNHCALPGCTEAGITVTFPVTITVQSQSVDPYPDLPVYAFNGEGYTGFHGTTDANGQVSLTLPQGDYRFRADTSGTQFWSGETNHCTLPGCTGATITVTLPVTVTVLDTDGLPAEGLPVYAFDESTYTGFHGTTDENGQVMLTLPQGDYRFRADFDGVHFWSSETDHCSVPGCLEAAVELPGGGTAEQAVTIDYTYDPLYRLTAADYDSGEYFHYTYDSVGNRLTQQTQVGTITYVYDITNRLTEVDGTSYTWSANGNLLSDGESTYTYDHANRLSSVVQGEDTYNYTYNGLGDRLTQMVNGEATNYTLDTVTGLTQVLDDGANAYLYGLDRVGEQQPAGWAYHIPDALGSVRQLVDADAGVTLAQSYEPFGSVMASSGLGETSYSFTGEWADGTGLVHLRARYYAPWQGRFLSRDSWNGDSNIPMSFNAWLYVHANPVNYSDPSGYIRSIPPPFTPCTYCYLITDPVVRGWCLEGCRCRVGSGSESQGDNSGAGNKEFYDKLNISMYYIPHETQSRFDVAGWGTDVVRMYGGGELAKKDLPEEKVKAKEYFLYSDEGVCMQGTGRLEDGRYIECATERVNWAEDHMPSEYQREHMRFDLSTSEKRLNFIRFETFAAAENSPIAMGTILYIPGIIDFLRAIDPGYSGGGKFRRTDSGGRLKLDQLDIFAGEGATGYSAYKAFSACSSEWPESDWWNRAEGQAKCPAPYFPMPEYLEVYIVK